MKNGKPNHGSGKTRFNRGKPKGASWTALREDAIKAGTFRRHMNEKGDTNERT